MRKKKRLVTVVMALVLTVALAVPLLSTGIAMAASPTWQSQATNVNSSDGATSLTTTKPAGTADGDLLIASVSHNQPDGGISGPAGWTQINQGNSGSSSSADIRLSV
ncbi:MAG: hypothetical protein KAH98_04465 [Dehalococcoidia bacterium]|nr:hypothetical protein [Dehalococcoidia bacterium]